MSIYEYTVKDGKGEPVSLSAYKGKVLLIVNTATRCGFTPQYEGLEKLYSAYKDRGFEILDFPCNQFMHQAPEDNDGIAAFCSLNYGTTFKPFAKINVNGKEAAPVFEYLKKNSKHRFSRRIKWNFTKFLVDREGKTIQRFAPTVKPETIESEILKLLEA